MNKYTGFFLILAVTLLLTQNLFGRVYNVNRGSNLQSTIDFAKSGDTIIIGEKRLEAVPRMFFDSLCGNCEDHQTMVTASYGFIIENKSLYLIGKDKSKSILKTNAGYGIFIVNSPFVEISNLTITGGVRDSDQNATDGAIVVRNSKVDLHDLKIINNDNRHDSIIVGIGGIIGREGAEIIAYNIDIINNSWDGVALYRGAMATISDCIIKKGRGAGIGVTWDASCIAYRNNISEYWKGIGAFGTSWVIARNNAVYDNLGWGIIATQNSYMDIANNVVHHNGNCGVAPWSLDSRGRIVNNIITDNGWREKWVCPCVGVWNSGDWIKWEFSHNIVWNNKDGEYEEIWDQTGINGNLSVDPKFISDTIFKLKSNSPAIDSGHPGIYDKDGTRSDIGLYGGPQSQFR